MEIKGKDISLEAAELLAFENQVDLILYSSLYALQLAAR